MTQNEEYFPRGKVAPSVAKANKLNSDSDEVQGKKSRRRSKDKLDNLFNDFDRSLLERKGAKKGKKSKNALTPEEEKALGGKRHSDAKRFAVVPLSYDQVVEGMLSLGIITKITDHEIFVTLPGRVIGTVSITEVSTPYIKFIEKHAKKLDGENENVVFYTLKEMFWIGQSVVVKVKNVERGETRVKIALSLNPADIYANYSTTVLKEDMVLVAAVESDEDHGYVMDIGINGARCFLSRDDAVKFIHNGNFNRPLGIGQLVYCKINNITVHRLMADVKLTAFIKAVKSQKMDDFIGLNYSTLIPGMLVDVIVMETHKTGLMAHCMDLNGLVHQDHMKDEWTSPESLEIGSTVPARILYILPNLTTPYLTLQTEVVPLANFGDRTNRDKLGSKENIRVIRTEKRGLIVKIQDGGYKAHVPIFHLGDESLLTAEDISKKFKENSIHEARILKYCPLERMYICSFKKDLLNSDIVHPAKAVGGTKVTCQILQWNKGGAMVTFGAGMRGFIPNSMFRPETLSDTAKEKLVGSTHKARIFSRDSEKEKVILTVRREFVKSKGVAISSIEEAQIGMIGHAMIQSFNKVGVYVKTLGGCEGFIPASQLADKYIENFSETFHFGQIVECKVININEEKKHLVLSLRLDDEPIEKPVPKVKKGKRKMETPAIEKDDSSPARKKTRRGKCRRNKTRKNENTDTESLTAKDEANDEEEQDEEESENVDEEADIQSDADEGLVVPQNLSFWDTTVDATANDSDNSGSSDDDEDDPSEKKKSKMKAADLKISVPVNKVSGSHDESSSKATISLESIEKYEKGIISDPNDPVFWTGLMSHYSSIGILEKARAVGKQALDMIHYRDEKAKLKVWGALLKLEVKYGTEDSLKSTLAEAMQRNDQFECLKLMALVYDDADRFKDSEKTYRQIVKQFRLEPEAWIRFGTFYYTRKKFDSGRDLLNEALSAIPFNLRKFPLIPEVYQFLVNKQSENEIHYGEKARGESMFDHILAQPKHQQCSSLWITYVNALIKVGKYEDARSVFMRAFDVKWHAKKVKPLLKRYLEFETAHGTEESKKEFQNVALKVLNFSKTE